MPRTAPRRRIRRTVLAACAATAAALALAAPAAQADPSEPTPRIHAPSEPTPQIYAPPASSPQEQGRHTGPEIRRFLGWFYGEHGPTDQQREKWVSDLLKAKQRQNPDHDVLLCAQNAPRNIEVGPVTVAQSAGVGWATVTAYWTDGTTSTSTAYVALDSHPIELHDVVCAE
ncbi:hypothetical protein ABZ820_03250 [Streptomyces diacarni]|uniref:Secreted protein n=1 Tax=Streptomyces diacarni TaxID=2800381 RepID=A0A367ETT9_9ACTN|nr:hypothetical protein [Streptomyces diacarni]RCG21423.1 hypothetical protein DTL70_18510 [Streptomyces diacarni]